MKYYSEKLNKLYDTTDDLKKAEKAYEDRESEEKRKRTERAKRAKEVDDAYKHYAALLKKFVEDYGSYHTSFTGVDDIFSALDFLLR